MRRVIWSQAARRDLEGIERYWIDGRPDYVAKVLGMADAVSRRISEHLGIGTPVGAGDLRKYRLDPTPYLIFYRVTGDTLRILRVRHAREDWQPPA